MRNCANLAPFAATYNRRTTEKASFTFCGHQRHLYLVSAHRVSCLAVYIPHYNKTNARHAALLAIYLCLSLSYTEMRHIHLLRITKRFPAYKTVGLGSARTYEASIILVFAKWHFAEHISNSDCWNPQPISMLNYFRSINSVWFDFVVRLQSRRGWSAVISFKSR